MYKIAICDDEESSAVKAAELLKEYKNKHPHVNFLVDAFSSSIELLGAMEEKDYDIYILDIYIDKMNGIEIAELIRKRNDGGQIIFMTSSNAFYKEAFRIQAVHYLEKPILRDDFFAAMDRVCIKEDQHYISFKEGGEIKRIPIDDVICVESEDHYKRIVTDSVSYLVRSTMQQMIDDLDAPYFYLLGVKSIVNLKKVLKITKDSIIMENGTEFKIPRGTYRTISELVLKFSF